MINIKVIYIMRSIFIVIKLTFHEFLKFVSDKIFKNILKNYFKISFRPISLISPMFSSIRQDQ